MEFALLGVSEREDAALQHECRNGEYVISLEVRFVHVDDVNHEVREPLVCLLGELAGAAAYVAVSLDEHLQLHDLTRFHASTISGRKWDVREEDHQQSR